MSNYKLLMIRYKVIILLILVIFVSIIYFLRHPGLLLILKGEFTQEGWNNYPSFRYKIIDDMEAKINIWNLTANEIIDILGSADSEYYTDDSIVYIHYLIKGKTYDIPFYDNKLFYVITFTYGGKVEDIRIYESS